MPPAPRPAARTVAAVTAALVGGALLAAPAAAVPPPAGGPFISEVHYDNAGADAGERVEITAEPGTDMSGWSLVGVNGNGGATYSPTALSGVVGDSGVLVVDVVGLQNGSPDGLALLDASGALVQFLSYEGVFSASIAGATVESTDTVATEDGSGSVDGSIQLLDGTWTTYPDSNTFGARNTAGGGDEPDPVPVPVECEADGLTPVTEVQGTGEASPLVGQTVTVAGVVTNDPEGLGSVYVQDPAAAPGDASTAVNVFGPTDGLEIGDAVQVTGEVAEYFGLTQVEATAVAVCDEPAAMPEPVAIDWNEVDAEGREALEGMLVAPTGDYTVTEVYNLNRFGEVALAAGTERLRQATDVVAPGEEAAAYEAENAREQLLLDDGSTRNLANAGVEPSYGALQDPVRVGDRLSSFGATSYVLDYRYEAWRAQPTAAVTDETDAASFDDTNPRTDAPEDVGGDVQVATFNVLNYFTSFGGDARGADDEAGLRRQEAKIVTAVNALGAEVVGLEEIENSVRLGKDRDQALSTLVDALNADVGEDRWAFVPSPADLPATQDQDFIRNAFIYQPAAVELVGESVVDDDPEWAGRARQPLAQTFSAGGEEFTLVVNHFKSKGSVPSPARPGDEDTGDGQGNGNPTRVAEAERLVAFVDSLELASQDVMLLGDFNSYTQEDPLDVVEDAGYTNLNEELNDELESTYVFSGRSGSLDHLFGSPSVTEKVTGVDVWDINAVESYGYQYDGFPGWYDEDPFRSSDHDPVVVGLDLGLGGGEEPGDGTTSLQLLGINDFHGRLGEAVALSGTVEEQREREDVDGSLFLSAGDNIGASPFVSSVQQDAPTLEVLNEMGLETSAVGNHEFDRGVDDLLGRVGVDGESGLADFPTTGANVYRGEEPVLPQYSLHEVDGVTVGVIGVVTQQTASLVSPSGIEGITFGDPVEAANRVAAELTDGADDEADVLVLAAHEGAPEGEDASTLEEQLALDTAFADIVAGTSAEVDAIFTGHTHQTYAWQAPVPGGEGTRPVIQTGQYAENLGRTVLEYDAATDTVTSSTVENLPLTERTPEDLVAAYPRVAEVAETVAAAEAFAEEIGSEVLGSVTADITRAFTPGGVEDRGSYSALGGLLADTYVYGAASSPVEDADLGLVNPGGLRADLLYGEDGVVTLAEANAVTPFANDLVVTSLTGQQLVDVLEQQWQPAGSSRPFLALGSSEELEYSYDPEAATGERIIVSSVRVSGEPIDLGATYRVATNSFLASGGDNFTAFAGGTTQLTGLIDFDSFAAYIRELSPLRPEDYLGRVTVGEAPEVPQGPTVEVSVTTVTAGDRVPVDVAGFTPYERVSLAMADGTVGRIRTDADGAGSATVRVSGRVPAGSYPLVATGAVSGTTATVQVEVVEPAGALEP